MQSVNLKDKPQGSKVKNGSLTCFGRRQVLLDLESYKRIFEDFMKICLSEVGRVKSLKEEKIERIKRCYGYREIDLSLEPNFSE